MGVPDDLLLPVYKGNLNLWTKETKRIIQDGWVRLSQQVNLLSSGRISACYSTTAPPTSGRWTQGDLVRNSNPEELGTAGAKYVVFGWLCVKSGEPGLWVECRFLTGN